MAHKTSKFHRVESRSRRTSLSGAGEDDDDQNQRLVEDEKEERTGDEESVELIEGQAGEEEENVLGEGEQQELIPHPKMEVLCREEENPNVDVDIDGDDEEQPVSLISFPGTNAPCSSASQRVIIYTSEASRGAHLNHASHGGSLSPPREMATATEQQNTSVLSTEDKPVIRDERVGVKKKAADADGTARGSAVNNKTSKTKPLKDICGKRKANAETFERPSAEAFAAITRENIGLIYLRRDLLEELLDHPKFNSMVCNTFVKVRVPGEIGKPKICYRLVQIVGTRLQPEPYQLARKVTNVVLEVKNLGKIKDLKIDIVSNADIIEEECQTLRKSIKGGIIKALTVGDIQDKETSLRELKSDWVRTEKKRLVSLRDRAREKGLKTELRKLVERLQKLDSSTYLANKVQPEVIADPRMHPDYKSDGNDDETKDGISKILDKSFSSPGVMILPVGRLKGSQNESSRHLKGTSSKLATRRDPYHSQEGDRVYNSFQPSDKLSYGEPAHRLNGVESAEGSGGRKREMVQRRIEQQSHVTDIVETVKWIGNGRNGLTPAQKLNEKVDLSLNSQTRSGKSDYRGTTGVNTPMFATEADRQTMREPAPPSAPSSPQRFSLPSPNILTQAAIEAAEQEDIWHYIDPTGMMQGPFSMEKLREWKATGYFPEDFRIQRTTQPREESILLNDALARRFEYERKSVGYGSLVTNPNNKKLETSLGRTPPRYQSTVHQPAVASHVPHHHPKAKQAHLAAAMLPSCNYCGDAHKSTNCNVPAKELFCDYCEKQGHCEQVCFANHPERKQMQRCARLAPGKDIVCRHYAKGYCMRGDNCDYRHG